VYTSGRYPSEFEKTTVAMRVCDYPGRQGCILVYDLRNDPAEWLNKTPEQLAEAWRWKKDSEDPRLPVKKMQYNHCPAVAPLGVLDAASQARLKLDMSAIRANAKVLVADKTFAAKLCKAAEILDTQQQTRFVSAEQDVDGALYDGFFEGPDKQAMRVVRAAKPDELGDLNVLFKDHRLTSLLPLYKARNYPKLLTGEERDEWEKFRAHKLMHGGPQSKLAKYFERLQEVAAGGGLTGHQQYLIEELKLYGESIMPEPDM
jgi:exodeoxyribonuclease-1